jgi:hypothetical protein
MINVSEERLRELLASGQLELPLPGAGRTPERLLRLAELAASEDLSTARLAEAHCDAAAITAEAQTSLPADAVAGVWASRHGGGAVRAARSSRGWRLTGRLEFCSGVDLLDVALVDAAVDDGGQQLFLVPLRQEGVVADCSRWVADGLAATRTGRVEIDVELGLGAAVGPAGFYLDRLGFWHGSVGVAAVWAGGAMGVHRSTVDRVNPSDPHALAALGASAVSCWELEAIMFTVGADIDERPETVRMTAALTVRHLVAEACSSIMTASERATGPGPLAFDGAHAQRIADLRMYIQQHHYGTDLAAIGADTTRTTGRGRPRPEGAEV